MSKIVVLTGAGISAESGIKTFRGSDGLWEGHRVEDVASPEGFLKNPKLVQEFYNQRRRQLLEPGIKPNPGHVALAELERKSGSDILVVTQNVDNLHERAGTTNLIHMHGELLKVKCVDSDEVFQWEEDIKPETKCPCCKRVGVLRPDIVWFGEMPYHMEKIYEELETCKLFVSIGTSGNVYPAAGFVQAVPSGCKTIEINIDATGISSFFQTHLVGPAGLMVPKLESFLPK